MLFEIWNITFSPSFYGFMYAISFIIWYLLIKKSKKFSEENLESLFMYVFMWVILWWRVGYVLFYNFSQYIESSFEILKVWNGGMSFHGGVLWVVIALIIFAKKKWLSFYKVIDEIAYIIPIGLFLGRIWNYVNKELLGFSYSWPLAIQTSAGSFFPSPLLEAFLEWAILFTILRYFHKKKSFDGQIGSIFLIGYGVFRIFVEVFFRTPDAHIGYIFPYISMGSILSFCMIIVGVWFYRKLRTPQK